MIPAGIYAADDFNQCNTGDFFLYCPAQPMVCYIVISLWHKKSGIQWLKRAVMSEWIECKELAHGTGYILPTTS
jgi:hypothetical protein